MMIDNCETAEISSGSVPLKINTNKEYVKEGEGSYLSEGGSRSNGNEIFIFRNTSGGWDVSDYMEAGYLHFWLYIEDNEKLSSGQMELSSAGKADVQELAWFSASIGAVKQGWNEIVLPLFEADRTPADFDPTKVTWMRLYLIMEDGNYGNYYIDDIHFSNVGKQ